MSRWSCGLSLLLAGYVLTSCGLTEPACGSACRSRSEKQEVMTKGCLLGATAQGIRAISLASGDAKLLLPLDPERTNALMVRWTER